MTNGVGILVGDNDDDGDDDHGDDNDEGKLLTTISIMDTVENPHSSAFSRCMWCLWDG